MLKDENGKILSGEAERKAWHALHTPFLKLLNESEEKINIKFIKPEDFKINQLDYIANQLIVIFKDGEIMTLPPRVVGRKAHRYLGFRLTKVKLWGILPVVRKTKGTELNLIDIYPYGE